MIENKVVDTIKKDRQKGQFIYPDYGRYSFGEISNTILSLFGAQIDQPTLPPQLLDNGGHGFKKVVTFFIDGVGFDQIVKYQRAYKFFDLLSKRASVYPLTALFPSTTANALTSFYGTQYPTQHALLEWDLYFKEFGEVIETLPFKLLDSKEPDSLAKIGGNSEMLFDGVTMFERMAKVGVKPFYFFYKGYAESAYLNAVRKGSETIPYQGASDLFPKLRKLVTEVQGPAYFNVYWAQVDHAEHEWGPDTQESLTELSIISHLLTAEFIDKIDPKIAEETLLILVSDHGQIGIDPKKTVYLNNYPEIMANFQMGENGKPILPGGSSRDIFLHIKEDKLAETQIKLKETFKDQAEIITTKKALETGLFGQTKPSQRFFDRAGNLLVLPFEGNRIWYQHIPGEVEELIGMHGGLSEQEMFVPFVEVQLSKLKE